MYSRPIRGFVIVCWAAAMALGSVTAMAQANLLTDLGIDSGVGINNSGQVALKNSLYSNGTLTPYPAGSINGQTVAFTGAAINASGQVAGQLFFHAAIYSNGVVTDLCNICYDASAASSSALGINDSGNVVGWDDIDGNATVDGVIITAGSVTDIGALDRLRLQSVRSEALGINNNDVVIGYAAKEVSLLSGTDVFEGQDVIQYENGTLIDLFPGIGYAINSSGQMTGRMDQITFQQIPGHAFLYGNGTTTDLGALLGGATSVGYAINSAGQVVGTSDLAGSTGTHAFFFNGAMQDMNALVSATDPLQPFVTLTDARGINDSRLIVVNGIDSRTQLTHAYLLQGPWLDVAPGSLFFPSQAIGKMSSAQSVALTNSGPTTLALGTISTSADFSQTSDCAATLAAGSSCIVVITFRPTAAGDRTGSLTVISAGVPIGVPLAGIAPIQVNISSSATATTAGIPVKLTWTLSPGASCTATGGSAADGWTGNIAASGTQSITETTAGTYPYGLSCTAGSQSQSGQTSVVVTWPAVSVTLTASPATFTAGQSVTLKWNSANATGCSATGGATGDTWPGAKATSGTSTLTETAPISSSSTLAYSLTCTSSVSGLSASASAKAVENAVVPPTPPTMSGGGGSLDLVSVLLLTGIALWLRLRARPARETTMSSRPLRFLRDICLFAGLAFGVSAANAQSMLTDLGPGTAFGLNNSGQVVLSNGVWSKGTVTAFPTGFTANAINSTGGLAGVITDYLGGTYAAAYLNGTLTNIGLMLPDEEGAGMEFGAALGINDSQQVVGGALEQPLLVNFAFIYSNGAATILPSFPPFTGIGPGSNAGASGINNSGQVVGTMFNAAPIPATNDAFIYDSNTGALTDLGPGSAVAINASGQVVGTNAAGNCIFNNGMATPIPIQGVAINATGQVVGGTFLYNGGVIDLNDLVSATDPLKPFVTLSNAVGINDNLLIAVNGLDSRTHEPHAYLMQAPWITISPGPLTFPRQTIGTVSAAQTLMVTNAGTTPLAIDGIAISGDFSQTNNCAASLVPSGVCTISITFGPKASGTLTGNLTLTTSGVPMTVPLAGTAPIQVTISASPPTTLTGKPITLTWQASPGAFCTATGGSAADGWTGTVPLTGTRSVTESTAGTYSYGLTCTNSSQYQPTHTAVVVAWPPLTVSLATSSASIVAGSSTTLTWTSVNAKTCVASGGGTNDGWAGTTRATSGSAAIIEPVAVASPLTLTYTLTCSNSGTSQSTPASVKVVVNPPAMSGGGGGALDSWAVLFLAGVATMRRLRRRTFRDMSSEISFRRRGLQPACGRDRRRPRFRYYVPVIILPSACTLRLAFNPNQVLLSLGHFLPIEQYQKTAETRKANQQLESGTASEKIARRDMRGGSPYLVLENQQNHNWRIIIDIMHTTTTFELPGFRVTKSLGVVRGITVRTRSLPLSIIGGLRTLFGGRAGIFSDLCESAREESFQLMLSHARRQGANAVVGIRYDTGPMVGAAEVLCYGTAVIVEPV